MENEPKLPRPTLEDRVEALEDIVTEIFAMIAKRDPAFGREIADVLTKAIRQTDEISETDETIPDEQYSARTPQGEAVEFLAGEFKRKAGIKD